MTGVVYFIEALGGDAVKVGYTKHDPQKRLKELQTGNHCDLELIGVIPGPQYLEGQIHHTAGPGDRLRGEWFTRRWAEQVIERNVVEFIPADDFRWVDPSVGHFCETGAFVSADDLRITEPIRLPI